MEGVKDNETHVPLGIPSDSRLLFNILKNFAILRDLDVLKLAGIYGESNRPLEKKKALSQLRLIDFQCNRPEYLIC